MTAIPVPEVSYDGSPVLGGDLNCSGNSIYDDAATLKIMPNAENDVSLFVDTDVSDAADGKALFIYRKAAEGDKYFKFFINQYLSANCYADANLIFESAGYLRFIPGGGILYLDLYKGSNLTIRKNGGAGGTLTTLDNNTGAWDMGSGNITTTGTIKGGGYQSSDGSPGATGSFTTADGKTVTVKNGLITAIA